MPEDCGDTKQESVWNRLSKLSQEAKAEVLQVRSRAERLYTNIRGPRLKEEAEKDKEAPKGFAEEMEQTLKEIIEASLKSRNLISELG